MSLIAKKICMVGPFAVGKTSLVRQFVESLFSDKYHTTIGVKISKKQLQIDEHTLQLMLWDIEGVDAFTELRASYLRGAAGIMLVVDGTRPTTIGQIRELMGLVHSFLDDVPLLVLINKCDLKHEWRFEQSEIHALQQEGVTVLETSAKTGEGVEAAFRRLAQLMLEVQA
ncbi:MAG: Rab family GTPase [Oleiphilaceae bacterium]|nr:Rab family GTPase [Oleiphilaceae bacterium]